MRPNANLLKFGEDLKERMHVVEGKLPIGVGIHLVSDQPKIVEEAVGGFTKALVEAVVIVLVVSFVSLGLRAGMVVALTVPLVLEGTFLAMLVGGIELHRISLGALILSLGILVDDAMIAIEMMSRKLQEGMERIQAASFAFKATANGTSTISVVTSDGQTSNSQSIAVTVNSTANHAPAILSPPGS